MQTKKQVLVVDNDDGLLMGLSVVGVAAICVWLATQ
jgi:hypothetical protein